MYRPSLVRYIETSGLCGGVCVPIGMPLHALRCRIDASIAMPIDHTPLESSDTSTTDGSPVRSRFSSAAAMPPARLVPEMVSPYAGAGGPMITSMSRGVMLTAVAARAQNAVMSYPPDSDSSPRTPSALPRA